MRTWEKKNWPLLGAIVAVAAGRLSGDGDSAARLIPLVDATLFITASPLWILFVIWVWKRERSTATSGGGL